MKLNLIKPTLVGLGSVCMIAMIGCSTPSAIKYEDPGTANSLTLDFDLPDVNSIADAMVDSMLTSSVVHQLSQNGERPIMIVDRVQNRTDQHIDTISLTDSIRTQLIQSGKFRFTDKHTRTEQQDELEYQNNGLMVDKSKAIQMGRQYGARYMVTGALVSYVTGNDRTRAKSYKMTLNLIDLETGLIEWADEKPILKSQKRRG